MDKTFWKQMLIFTILYTTGVIIGQDYSILVTGFIAIPLWILALIFFSKWFVDREEANKLIQETKEGILGDSRKDNTDNIKISRQELLDILENKWDKPGGE